MTYAGSGHGGVTMLDVVTLSEVLERGYGEVQEEIIATDSRCRNLYFPRPVTEVLITGPNGKTIVFGPFRTKALAMDVIRRHSRRAIKAEFRSDCR